MDDDGQAYMYWGNPNTYYVMLNDDMISTKGDIVKLDYHIDHYQEGPWFYKRNGHYYLWDMPLPAVQRHWAMP